MLQTVLSVNGQDSTLGYGNSAEEFEAIAVMLLRAAQAIRNGEEGSLDCFGKDEACLVHVSVHHCPGDSCPVDETDEDPPQIEEWMYVPEARPLLAKLYESLIEEYRLAAKERTL